MEEDASLIRRLNGNVNGPPILVDHDQQQPMPSDRNVLHLRFLPSPHIGAPSSLRVQIMSLWSYKALLTAAKA
jgi:hypothetical protein